MIGVVLARRPQPVERVVLGLVAVEIAIHHQQGTRRDVSQFPRRVDALDESGVDARMAGGGCDGVAPIGIAERALVEQVEPAAGEGRDAHHRHGGLQRRVFGEGEETGVAAHRNPGHTGAGGVEARIGRQRAEQRPHVERRLLDHAQELDVHIQAGFERIDRVIDVFDAGVVTVAVIDRIDAHAGDAALRQPDAERQAVGLGAPHAGDEKHDRRVFRFARRDQQQRDGFDDAGFDGDVQHKQFPIFKHRRQKLAPTIMLIAQCWIGAREMNSPDFRQDSH